MDTGVKEQKPANLAKKPAVQKTTAKNVQKTANLPKKQVIARKTTKKSVKEVTPVTPAICYAMGAKKYAPRVEHNAVAWEKVVQQITIKGKGKATHEELCEVLKNHFTKVEENHHDFIGYMERRGSLKKL